MNSGTAAAVLLELEGCSGMHVSFVLLYTDSRPQGATNSRRTRGRRGARAQFPSLSRAFRAGDPGIAQRGRIGRAINRKERPYRCCRTPGGPMRYDWSRYHVCGYECSTAGDTRFSPLFARLSDGRLIVDTHQLHWGPSRLRACDWRLGKARRALTPNVNLWQSYLSVWAQWARENPALMLDLAARARYGILTDRFARTGISQARALAHLLNESRALSESASVPDANTPPAPRVCAATTPVVRWLARARDTR